MAWWLRCAVAPTVIGVPDIDLPDIQTKLYCNGKAGTIIEPDRDFRGEDRWHSPNRICNLHKVWNGLLETQKGTSGVKIWNADDGFTLVMKMQNDGNLVLYDDSCFILCWRVPIWSTDTAGNNGARAVMEDGGKLKIYGKNSCHQLWSSPNAVAVCT